MKPIKYLILLITINSFSQVGIGTDNPSNDALLELTSLIQNKGLVLPQLALTSTESSAPMTNHNLGMMVYNTSYSGDLVPGYYYDDGSKWVPVKEKSTPNTTDNTDDTEDAFLNNYANTRVELKTKSDGITPRDPGTEFVITDSGNVGIGTSNPTASLHVNGTIRLQNLIRTTEQTFDPVIVGDDGTLYRYYIDPNIPSTNFKYSDVLNVPVIADDNTSVLWHDAPSNDSTPGNEDIQLPNPQGFLNRRIDIICGGTTSCRLNFPIYYTKNGANFIVISAKKRYSLVAANNGLGVNWLVYDREP